MASAAITHVLVLGTVLPAPRRCCRHIARWTPGISILHRLGLLCWQTHRVWRGDLVKACSL